MALHRRTDSQPKSEATSRAPISAFVICFNEEDHIEDCLESLSFCDEVIVVDSFSSDRTVELAERMGAKVIQRAWSGFRAQKAFGLESVGNDWVLNLDADERVSDELRDSIVRVLEMEHRVRDSGQAESEINGYYVNRVVFFLGRWWRRGGWYPEYRLRFLKKSKTVWGGRDPHERPEVSGRTAILKGELFHYTYESVDEQLERLNGFSSIAAKESFERGRKVSVWAILLNPLIRFVKFYFLKRGFLEGQAGFVVALNEACYTYMKYAKLWGRHYQRSIAHESKTHEQ